MLDQNTFTETIRAVQDIIRTSAEPMTREEILSYFKDMDLNAQQEEMVLEFLSTPHDDPQPEENEPETKEAEYEETAEKEETLQQYHQLCRTAGLGIHGSGSHCTTSYKWVLRRFAVYVRTGGHSGGMAAGRVNPIGWYVCTQQKSVKRL